MLAALSPMHPDQRMVADGARRFNVLDCGRRWGKTRFLVRIAAERVLAGRLVGYYAPESKTLGDFWREARGALAPVTTYKNEADFRIEAAGGGVLECWSLHNNPDASRGRKYHDVLIDEAAKITALEEAWTRAIRPTLTDYRGGAWFASTPRGFDYFKALYDRGQDPARETWMSWQRPTVANPHIDPAEVEEACKDLPEQVADQEYRARFIDFAGAVFRNIAAVCIGEPEERPHEGHVYGIGVDWGQSQDFTAMSVWCYTCQREVWLERSNRIEYDAQIERLATLVARYAPALIIPEVNSMGQPVVERMVRRWGERVVPFTTSAQTKPYIVRAFSVAMERSEIVLLSDPVGTAELQAYEAKRLPSGMWSYGAPSGMHDDTIMARMIAATPLYPDDPSSGVVTYEDDYQISEDF